MKTVVKKLDYTSLLLIVLVALCTFVFVDVTTACW